MPRKLLQRTGTFPYHVTARANNREEFPLPLGNVWKVLGDECLFLSTIYQVEFQAAVLMPNHFHLIITVPDHDLGKVMNEFLKSISRTVKLLSGRSGHVFGGAYHWSLITSSRYFGHALKYVYRNPVRARICERVEDYPYSTLYGLLGSAALPFPIHYSRASMELALPSANVADEVDWLNRPFPKEAEERIQKGLRRKLFEKIMDRRTGRPVEMLNELL